VCEKRWRCDAASTGLFLDPSRGKIAGICFVTLAEAARRLSAVGSSVLTAPAQGVVMAASALTPTSAITRFILQASTFKRHLRSTRYLGFASGSALHPSSIRELFAYITIYRVVKWLTIEYEDPWTRGKQRKRHSRRRPRSL
jgi:hypothetical protein